MVHQLYTTIQDAIRLQQHNIKGGGISNHEERKD
jgi:hypothetical protein